MDYSNNLNTRFNWKIEHEHLLKFRNSKDAQGFQSGMLKPKAPAHLGLCGQQRKCLVSGDKESMANFGVRFLCKVTRVLVKILIGSRTKQVARLHCRLVLRRLSSSRRCFASQYPAPASIGGPEVRPSRAIDSTSSRALCSART